jgi:XTP/dITP diphosphohydrolase
MTKLLIATYNAGKVVELAELLAGLPCEVLGCADLPEPPPLVEETGATFSANALLKAERYHAATGLLTLADDSGLEVDVLGGAPGVYSARYAGAGAGSAELVAKLLEEMKNVPDAQRVARFVCVLALVGPRLKRTFTGSCAGVIAHAPRGAGGFGFDPVFVDVELKRTFAELSRAEKAARSHRGRALAEARGFLEEWLTRRPQPES